MYYNRCEQILNLFYQKWNKNSVALQSEQKSHDHFITWRVSQNGDMRDLFLAFCRSFSAFTLSRSRSVWCRRCHCLGFRSSHRNSRYLCLSRCLCSKKGWKCIAQNSLTCELSMWSLWLHDGVSEFFFFLLRTCLLILDKMNTTPKRWILVTLC